MKITDKDRLDFLDSLLMLHINNEKRNSWIELHKGTRSGLIVINDFRAKPDDGFEHTRGFGRSFRQAIDNAIMAMREKDK